jgi:hypothetical protein
MRYLSLLIACIAVAFTSCKKCGHCDTSYGNGRDTFCGDEYEDAKNACEQNGYAWIDE